MSTPAKRAAADELTRELDTVYVEPTDAEWAAAAGLFSQQREMPARYYADTSAVARLLAAERAAIHARYEAVAADINVMPVPGGPDGDPWDNGWICARETAAERIRQVAAQ